MMYAKMCLITIMHPTPQMHSLLQMQFLGIQEVDNPGKEMCLTRKIIDLEEMQTCNNMPTPITQQ